MSKSLIQVRSVLANTLDGFYEVDDLGNFFPIGKERVNQLAKTIIRLGLLRIGVSEVEFAHTAVNLDAHLFINGMHDPALCPECLEPGTLHFDRSVV